MLNLQFVEINYAPELEDKFRYSMEMKALTLSLCYYAIEICLFNQLPWIELSSQSLN